MAQLLKDFFGQPIKICQINSFFQNNDSPLLSEFRKTCDAKHIEMKAGPGQGQDDAQACHHHRVQLQHPLKS